MYQHVNNNFKLYNTCLVLYQGKIIAKYFHAFGAKILIYDKKIINLKKYSVVNSLENIVANSDIITLHVDYNSSSHRMMNASIFNKFRTGNVYFLITS